MTKIHPIYTCLRVVGNCAVALLIAGTLTCQGQTLTNSLTACYSLDGNASETINSLTGTLSSVSASADRFNFTSSALAFGGSTTSYIELPNNTNLKPASALTIAGWFKPSNLAQAHLIYTANTSSLIMPAYHLKVDFATNGIGFLAGKMSPTANNEVLSTTTITANTWYHVAFTIDNNMIQIYVNGVMENSVACTFNGFDYDSGKGVFLGGTNESLYNQPFNGSMDNLKFYSRVLSSTELFDLYALDPRCTAGPSVQCGMIYTVDNTTKLIRQIDPSSPNTATNLPVIVPPNFYEIAVGPAFSFSAPDPTYWTTIYNGSNFTYWYYNGYQFVNSNHWTGVSGPAAIGGSKNLIYTRSDANIYKYNGTGSGSLVTTVSNILGPGDIFGDETDNFYLLKTNAPQALMIYSPAGVPTCSYALTNAPVSSVGGYVAMGGDRLIYTQSSAVHVGTISGSNIAVTSATTQPLVFTNSSGNCALPYNFQTSLFAYPGPSVSCITPTLTLNAGVTVPVTNYAWTGPGISGTLTTPTIQVTQPGVYSCSLTSCTGGTSFATYTVLSGPVWPTPTISATGTLSCGQQTVSLTVAPYSATTAVEWKNQGAAIGLNSGSIVVSSPGMISARLTNTITGCVATATFFLAGTQTTQALPATICAGQSTTLSSIGATSYTWLPGNLTGSTIVVSPTAATVYTAVGAISPSCVTEAILQVSVVSIPTVVMSPATATFCAGSGITLTAAGAESFTWNPSNVTATTLSVNPASAAIYSLTGMNGGLCSNTQTLLVTPVALPVLSPTANPQSICVGGTATLSASNATSYVWSAGAQITASIIVSPTVFTTYTVTGTASTGCSSTATVVVYSHTQLTITPAPASKTICPGDLTTIGIIGSAQYYTFQPIGVVTSTTSWWVSPSVTTVYSVVGVGGGNCLSNVATITVNVNTPPVLNVSGGTGTFCPGVTQTLVASGNAVSYTWSPGGSTNTVFVVTPLQPTTYALLGTSANGCSTGVLHHLNVIPGPSVTVNVTPGYICAGSSVSLTASGASSYTWSIGNSTTTSVVLTPTANLNYTVYASSGGQCNSVNEYTTTVYPSPTVIATASPDTICAGKQIAISGSGASSYTIYPSGATTSLVTQNPSVSTVYTVAAKNVWTCPGTATVLAVVNPTSPITVITNTNILCRGDSLKMSALGSNTYTWMPGNITGSATTFVPAFSTVFNVTGSNVHQCTTSISVPVTVIQMPTVQISASSPTICTGDTLVLTGSGAATYSWIPLGLSSANVTLTPSSSVTYTLTGNIGACKDQDSVNITVKPKPIITVSGPSDLCIGDSTALSAAGATSFTWQPGTIINASISVKPTTTTIYTVTGSANGCSAVAFQAITLHPKPQLSVSSSHTQRCAGELFTLTANGAISYTWVPGQFASTLTVVATPANQHYTVIGINSASCTNNNTISVTVVPSPPVEAVAEPSVICAGETTTLSATGASLYKWSTGSNSYSITEAPAATTIYSVTGTATTSCSFQATLAVEVNECLSLENKNLLLPVQVFPTIFNESISVVITGIQKFSLAIHDELGRAVLHFTDLDLGTSIDTRSLSRGVYYLLVLDSDPPLKPVKIIKY